MSDRLIFRIYPDASISGKITDSENEAVPNATILLFRRDASSGFVQTFQIAQTGSDDRGYYHFGHLQPGRYFVVVSAQPWYNSTATSLGEASRGDPLAIDNTVFDVAYPTTYYPGVTNPSSASPIVLIAGENVIADVVLAPAPALRLRINRVNSGAGQPSSVSLKEYVFGTLIDPPSTKRESLGGAVEIESIPAGKYILELESPSATDGMRGRVIELTADVDIDANSTATLPVVSGVVQMEGGLSLDRQAFVRLWNTRTGETMDTELAANGEFSLNGDLVVPGTYFIFLVNGESSMVGTISASGAKVTGQSIQISDSTHVHLDICVSRTLSTISGTAQRNGKPLPGAMIVLVPENTESNVPLFRRDQSDSDGTFTLRDVLPGKYKILGIDNGWDLEWAESAVLKPRLHQAVDIEIQPNMRYHINVNVD